MKHLPLDQLKKIATEIFLRAVSAVDPSRRLREIITVDQDTPRVKTDQRSEDLFHLQAFKNIFLIGTGKASASMAQAMEDLLADRISAGVITTKLGHRLPLRKIQLIDLARQPADAQKIAAELGIPFREAFQHLAHLTAAGIVREQEGSYELDIPGLEQFAREQFATAPFGDACEGRRREQRGKHEIPSEHSRSVHSR